MVELYKAGKPVSFLSREYQVERQNIYVWIRLYDTSKSFKSVDSLTEEQKDFKKLQKEVEQLKLENEILKKAALILGRK